jgi:hypothetical protein
MVRLLIVSSLVVLTVVADEGVRSTSELPLGTCCGLQLSVLSKLPLVLPTHLMIAIADTPYMFDIGGLANGS